MSVKDLQRLSVGASRLNSHHGSAALMAGNDGRGQTGGASDAPLAGPAGGYSLSNDWRDWRAADGSVRSPVVPPPRNKKELADAWAAYVRNRGNHEGHPEPDQSAWQTYGKWKCKFCSARWGAKV